MDRRKIFEGLRVVELASVLAGPAVGMFFAELGADVIKIENKSGGDLTRRWKQQGEDITSNVSSYYHSVNWNKKVLFCDLLNPHDYNEVLQLIASADILISNFKSGDDVKFNLVATDLVSKFPSLIIGEIGGYPDSYKVAFDAVLQAESGMMSINGTAASGPIKLPIAFVDLFTAHQLKEGILVAMIQKAKTGKGSIVKTTLFDSAIASLANQASNWLNNNNVPQLQGSLHPNIAPYGEVFMTKDLQMVLLAVGTDAQFNSLCDVLNINITSSEIDFSTNDKRLLNREELKNIIQNSLSEISCSEFLSACERLKIPAGKVNSIDEVFALPSAQKMILNQVEANNSISKRVATIAFDITPNSSSI